MRSNTRAKPSTIGGKDHHDDVISNIAVQMGVSAEDVVVKTESVPDDPDKSKIVVDVVSNTTANDDAGVFTAAHTNELLLTQATEVMGSDVSLVLHSVIVQTPRKKLVSTG